MNKKYTLYDIMQWNKTIRHLTIVERLTKKRACEKIGNELGVPPLTIAYYTTPRKYKTPSKSKNYRREYRNNPEVKIRIKECQKKYRNKPNIYIKRKNYDLKYKRVVRHIDSYFPQIFNSNPKLPLSEISSRIDSLSGINLKESTLETLLNKYNGKARDQPLIKTETGQYRLNPSFYGTKQNPFKALP